MTGRRFSNLPKCNPSQSSPVLSIHAPSWLSCVLFEFFYSLERYFRILVNSMTIWSVLKLPKIAWPRAWPKIAWPSPFKETNIPTKHNDMLKNLNWRETDHLAISKHDWRVELGNQLRLRGQIEQDLNPQPSEIKSGASSNDSVTMPQSPHAFDTFLFIFLYVSIWLMSYSAVR